MTDKQNKTRTASEWDLEKRIERIEAALVAVIGAARHARPADARLGVCLDSAEQILEGEEDPEGEEGADDGKG